MNNATYIRKTQNNVIIERWTFESETDHDRQRSLLVLSGRGIVSSTVKGKQFIITRRTRKNETSY